MCNKRQQMTLIDKTYFTTRLIKDGAINAQYNNIPDLQR